MNKIMSQNTNPLVCDPGFMANPSLTACTGNMGFINYYITLLV